MSLELDTVPFEVLSRCAKFCGNPADARAFGSMLNKDYSFHNTLEWWTCRGRCQMRSMRSTKALCISRPSCDILGRPHADSVIVSGTHAWPKLPRSLGMYLGHAQRQSIRQLNRILRWETLKCTSS